MTEPSTSTSSTTEVSDSLQTLLERLRNRTEVIEAADCFPLNPSKSHRIRFIENRETEELTTSEEESDKEEEPELTESSTMINDPNRIGNTNWCQCGMCRPMESAVESICCYDVPEMSDKIPVGAYCITDNTEFKNECTNFERQDWNFCMSKFKINSQPRWPEYMRALRKLAYRAFIVWIYIFLGYQNRKPIPSCAVNAIRCTFPDPQGHYVGFLLSSDYVAEDMAYESD